MKREDLKSHVKKIIDEYSQKSYSELSAQQYPIIYEYVEDEQRFNVEIQCLEATNEYVHISIAVSSGGVSSYLPATGSVIVYKNGRIKE